MTEIFQIHRGVAVAVNQGALYVLPHWQEIWGRSAQGLKLGKPNLLEAARKRKENILQNSYQDQMSKELDADLRSRFKILL